MISYRKKICSSMRIIKTNMLKILAKAKFKRFGMIIKVLYGIVSVVSTCSILFGVILYLIGKFTSNNQSDNDLIMKQIRREVGDSTITSINVVDIHGFGNDSIVVTAGEETSVNGLGELIILESVNNKMLNEMNDPLGLSSSYRTAFTQELTAEQTGLYPLDVSFINIDRNAAKEIMVQFYCWGTNFGANYPAIYRYSYETEQYELFGTLPIPVYIDNNNYDSNGEGSGYEVIYNKTSLNGYIPEQVENKNVHEIVSDGINEYDLPLYSDYCCAFWTKTETDYERNNLVVVYRNFDTNLYGINIYCPSEKNNELKWGLMGCITDVEFEGEINTNSVQKILDEKANERIGIDLTLRE